ncbi:MAG: glucokinase [Nitrospinales bacterium]
MKSRVILAGDIGGTKALLALFEEKNGSLTQVEEASFASEDYAGLKEILDDFLRRTGAAIEKACLGVPGPVVHGKCRTTHHHWWIDAGEVSNQLKIDDVFLINDMEALAYAVPFLPEDRFEVLQAGDGEKRSRIGLIAPGTGLGQAFLIVFGGGEFGVLPSEGGHCDFAPRNELEFELFRFLRQTYERVSIERVLSGYGLSHIYRFIVQSRSLSEPDWLMRDFREKDAPAVIAQNALLKKSPACEQALDLFVSIFGAVAGNMALQALAGICLGGGIAPKIIAKLKEETFMEAFLAKGRFRDLLRGIPVKVIIDDKAALLGAARYAIRGVTGRQGISEIRDSREGGRK